MQTTSTTLRSLTVLRRGSTGNDVRLLQQRLNAVRTVPGLTGVPVLVIDGIFGTRTEAAVRQFQDRLNLVVDGVVGSQTWSTLFQTSLPDLLFSETANVRPFRVEFLAGSSSATVRNNSVRGDFEVYVVSARAGQTLRLEISSLEDNAVVNAIIAPNNQMVVPGTDDIFRFPLTGDHFIVVGKDRGNASYQLEITIS